MAGKIARSKVQRNRKATNKQLRKLCEDLIFRYEIFMTACQCLGMGRDEATAYIHKVRVELK